MSAYEIRDFARTILIDKINAAGKASLVTAYNNYLVGLSDEAAAPLACLNLTQKDIADFEEQMTSKYGEQYTHDSNLKRITLEKLSVKPGSKAVSDHYSALMLDGLVALNDILKLEPSLVGRPPSGRTRFFRECREEIAALNLNNLLV